MANAIKKITHTNGSKAYLGNIETAAIRGVEQGLTQLKYMDIKSQTDTATETLSAADAGKVILIPNVGQDSIYSLPAPQVGLHFNCVGFGALAADTHDVSFHTGTLNTDYFHGAIVHHDSDQTSQTTAVVWGDGDSNDQIKLDVPEAFDIHFMGKDSTSWYVWGWAASATLITIADS